MIEMKMPHEILGSWTKSIKEQPKRQKIMINDSMFIIVKQCFIEKEV